MSEQVIVIVAENETEREYGISGHRRRERIDRREERMGKEMSKISCVSATAVSISPLITASVKCSNGFIAIYPEILIFSLW